MIESGAGGAVSVERLLVSQIQEEAMEQQRITRVSTLAENSKSFSNATLRTFGTQVPIRMSGAPQIGLTRSSQFFSRQGTTKILP